MTVSDEYKDYILDLLAPIGPIASRRMFGGMGLFSDGRMFALIANDVLFLKADDVNRAAMESLGAIQFQPFADKPTMMPYWEMDADIMEDPDRLCDLARGSVAAAARADVGKNSKTSRRKTR
ncbi:MAG: TfoX/Sxy family protein [Magnetospiraceae bacterium]